MKKSVLFVGSRANQVPLIIKAKEKYRIVICEISENTEGKYLADAYYCVANQDVDCIVEIAKIENVSAIITNSEPLLSLVERANHEMGFLESGAEAVRLMTDKHAMRVFLQEYKEFSVEHKLCHSVNEAMDFYKSLGKKAIIKPVDSSASRGVFAINNEIDISTNFANTQKYSKDQKSVLIEEFINGPEFTVDGLMSQNGKHYSLAISEKKHYAYNQNVACELVFSYYNSKYDYDLLRSANNTIVELTGYKLGMTHAEYKYDGERFRLIELMGRGGGNYIASEIVPFLSGYDTVESFIDSCVGGKSTIVEVMPEYQERSAVLKFFDTPAGSSGIVKKIEGEEVLRQLPAIIKYEFFFRIGDIISPAQNDSNRIGYYIACAEDIYALRSIMNQIQEKVKIII